MLTLDILVKFLPFRRKKKYVIYKAADPEGKLYIGQAQDLYTRIKGHKQESFDKNKDGYYSDFHKAIRKFGFENFDWEVIVEKETGEYLNIEEIFAIYCYGTFGNGYNMNIGGGSNRGYRASPETIEKLRISHLGQAAWNKGVPVPQERRERIAATLKALSLAPPNKGIPMTQEQKDHLSKVKTGIPSKIKGRGRPFKDQNGIIYASLRSASEILGWSTTHISHILRGKHKPTKNGYSFHYLTQEELNEFKKSS